MLCLDGLEAVAAGLCDSVKIWQIQLIRGELQLTKNRFFEVRLLKTTLTVLPHSLEFYEIHRERV